MSLPSDILVPRFLLFFSVDITGSTAYKHNKEEESWRQLFIDFYQDFPTLLQQECENITSRERDAAAHSNFFEVSSALISPFLWKGIGDELIFYTEITDSIYISFYVEAFRNTVHNYSSLIKSKRQTLGCKATAWTAEVPVNNASVYIRYGNSHIHEDFIGSAIDRGFRIAKYASEMKFVISVELAWLLTYESAFELRYDGDYELKGVVEKSGYPIIWLNMTRIGQEYALRPSAPTEELRKFCTEYIERHFALERPYIPNSSRHNTPPKGYQEKLAKLQVEQHNSAHILTSMTEENQVITPNSHDETETSALINELERTLHRKL